MNSEKSIESFKTRHGDVADFVCFAQQEQSLFQYRLCKHITKHFNAVEYRLQSLSLGKLVQIYLLLNEGRRFPKIAAELYKYFEKLGVNASEADLKNMPESLQKLLNEVSGDLLSFIKKYCGQDEIYNNEHGVAVFCPRQRLCFLALKRFASSKALKLAWITVNFSEQIANDLIVNAKRSNALQQKIQYLLNTALGQNNFAGFGVIEASTNDGAGLHCHIILAMDPDKLSSLRMVLKDLVDNAEKTAIYIQTKRSLKVTLACLKPAELSINHLPIDIGAADYMTKGLFNGKNIYGAKRVLMFNTKLFANKDVMARICNAVELCIKRLKICLGLPGCEDPKAFVSQQIINLFFKRYSEFSSA